VPTLQISGWYDVFCAGTIRNFERIGNEGGSPLARNARRLVIGPWKHNQWGTRLGDVDFGPEAADLLVDEVMGWFARWLCDKGTGFNEEPHVRAFLMGENHWISSATWPPTTTSLELFLGPDGQLDQRPANCSRDRVSFSYDPANPVPSVGGQSCCYDPAPMGPRDQRGVEQREDVLVFTTPPLREPVTVAGQPTLALHACSSAEDTDFTAKLVDVHPEGLAINLTEGIVRARAPRPGRVHEYEIVLRPTFATFAAGHAIRVEVSSSNFPAYERNPVPALQTVLCSAAHPSRLILSRI